MFNDEYVVEEYIKPTKIGKRLINDERADILGNFDDDDSKFTRKKAKTSHVISEENPFADDEDDEDDDDDDDDGDGENGQQEENDQEEENQDEEENDDEVIDNDENVDDSIEVAEEAIESDHDASIEMATEATETEVSDKTVEPQNKKKAKAKEKAKKKKDKLREAAKPSSLTGEQIQALVKGASKKNRFVLYVTNLNYETSREKLQEFFRVAGEVKSIRVPKVRRNAFAFVEMVDIEGFTKALELHNHTLDNYTVKIQISEGGKKKSANKKNILKQKNRKLAEMRQEGKQFGRSGKGYSKIIKKEINRQQIQQERRLAKKRQTK